MCGALARLMILGLLCSALVGCGEAIGTPLAGPSPARSAAQQGTMRSLTAVPTAPTRPGESEQEIVLVLLADHRLLAIRAADGTKVVERQLAPPTTGRAATGRYLALSPDGRQLVALLPAVPGAQAQLIIVTVATLEIVTTRLLPETVRFQGLTLGPKTGRIFLLGTQGTEAVVVICDPTGIEEARWSTGRPPDQIPQAQVSDDERTLLISFHATGVDLFDLHADGERRCQPQDRSERSCVGGHGVFVSHGHGIIVASGEQRLAERTRSGAVVRWIDSGLHGNHEMELALDSETGRLYLLGSCSARGGMSIVQLENGGQARPAVEATEGRSPDVVVARIVRPEHCGDRLVLGIGGGPIIAKSVRGPSGTGRAGEVVFLDRESGAFLRAVGVAGTPLDLIAVPLAARAANDVDSGQP